MNIYFWNKFHRPRKRITIYNDVYLKYNLLMYNNMFSQAVHVEIKASEYEHVTISVWTWATIYHCYKEKKNLFNPKLPSRAQSIPTLSVSLFVFY